MRARDYLALIPGPLQIVQLPQVFSFRTIATHSRATAL